MDVDIDDGEHYDPILSDIGGPEDNLVSSQLEEVVYQAIGDLPEELKVAITLREFEAMSYEEIAQVMECPVGTVRARIFRAREAIENRMNEMG